MLDLGMKTDHIRIDVIDIIFVFIFWSDSDSNTNMSSMSDKIRLDVNIINI